MNASKEEIARRYSHALFCAAKEMGILESVSRDLESLRAFVFQNRSELKLVLSSTVSSKVKSVFLNSILTAIKLEQATVNLVKLMLQHNRLHSIIDTIDSFHERLRSYNGDLIVKVKSVIPLGNIKLEEIKVQLQDIFKMNVVVDYSVDVEILGGILVIVGSHMFDATLRTKLNSLQKLALQI